MRWLLEDDLIRINAKLAVQRLFCGFQCVSNAPVELDRVNV